MFKILAITAILFAFSGSAEAEDFLLIPSPQDGLNWPQPQEHEKDHLPAEGCPSYKEIKAWRKAIDKDIDAGKAPKGWMKTPESQCHYWYKINRVKATLVKKEEQPVTAP